MTTFDTREKEFEARFKHDQELQFKITARRNRLAGLWAAQQLGLLGDTAEAYAERVVAAQLRPGGNRNVVNKLAADLSPRAGRGRDPRIPGSSPGRRVRGSKP